MSREIKFRAWNIIVQRYEHFTLQDLEGKKNIQWHILKIEQFTGLLDKNGVDKIFEGDIVSASGMIKGSIYEEAQIHDAKQIQGLGACCVAEGMGTRAWRAAEQELLGRGCKYAE